MNDFGPVRECSGCLQYNRSILNAFSVHIMAEDLDDVQPEDHEEVEFDYCLPVVYLFVFFL